MIYYKLADLLLEPTPFPKLNNLTLASIFSFKMVLNFPHNTGHPNTGRLNTGLQSTGCHNTGIHNTGRNIPEDVSILCLVLHSTPLLWLLFNQIEKRIGGWMGMLPRDTDLSKSGGCVGG